MEHGHTVVAPNLAGHGEDKTPFSKITLKTYIDNITDIITSSKKPITLVGHSMAGIIISQLAENIPDKIDQLIYVAAFIPGNNESLSQEARKAKNAGISTEMIIDEANNEISIKKSKRVKELFFNTCHEEDSKSSLALLQKEPFRPFIEPIKISKERFGKVEKLYIECLKDEALKPEDQKRMYTNAECEVTSIANADHSPFLSTPLELAGAILGKTLAKQPETKLTSRI